jgi:intracellular septation protein A
MASSSTKQAEGSVARRLADLLLFALTEFGPLIAFLLLNWRFGVKVAIAGTVAFVIVDGLRRLWMHVAFTRIYLLTSALMLVFGAVDLCSATPFMLQYEAVITNLAAGLFFVAGARGTPSLLQEIAEHRQGAPFPERADVRRFFELFTLAWACYFFLKVAIYAWMATVLPLAQAIELRSVIGSLSMVVMFVVSVTQGRRLFFLCGRLGLLPTVSEQTGAEPS